MVIQQLALQGRAANYPTLAGGLSNKIFGMRKESIKESMSDFQNIEHRLEFVANIHGVEFINDSRATNVNSTWFAIDSMTKPVIWIMGSNDKWNEFESLTTLVKEKVKAIVCLGKDNKKVMKIFSKFMPVITETFSAEDAVRSAYKLGVEGDVVLFSPGSDSFDLFENYEERGRIYKTAVRNL